MADDISINHRTEIDKAKAEGYKEGVKDGEGTKHGVKRYQMGFADGRAEGAREAVEYIKSKASRVDIAGLEGWQPYWMEPNVLDEAKSLFNPTN